MAMLIFKLYIALIAGLNLTNIQQSSSVEEQPFCHNGWTQNADFGEDFSSVSAVPIRSNQVELALRRLNGRDLLSIDLTVASHLLGRNRLGLGKKYYILRSGLFAPSNLSNREINRLFESQVRRIFQWRESDRHLSIFITQPFIRGHQIRSVPLLIIADVEISSSQSYCDTYDSGY